MFICLTFTHVTLRNSLLDIIISSPTSPLGAPTASHREKQSCAPLAWPNVSTVISLLINLNVSVEKCMHNVLFTCTPFVHEAPGGFVVPVMVVMFLVLPLFLFISLPLAGWGGRSSWNPSEDHLDLAP